MTVDELTEHQEQVLIIKWAKEHETEHPCLKFMYSVPNGSYHKNKRQAAILRSEGQKNGVPDLCLPKANKSYNGLYIELKKKKGGKISSYQREYLDYLLQAGYLAILCRGHQQAIVTIANYLEINE